MPQPLDLSTMPGEEKILNRALDAPKGLSIHCHDERSAFVLAMRLRNCIKTGERESKRLHPIDHPKYGVSLWQGLLIKQTGHIVQILPRETLEQLITSIQEL